MTTRFRCFVTDTENQPISEASGTDTRGRGASQSGVTAKWAEAQKSADTRNDENQKLAASGTVWAQKQQDPTEDC